MTAARLQGAFVWRAMATDAALDQADLRTQFGYQTVRCDNAPRNNVCEWKAEHSEAIRKGIEGSEMAAIYRDAALGRCDRALKTGIPDDAALADWWQRTRTRPHSDDAHRAAMAKEWVQIGCQTSGAPHANRGIALNIIDAAAMVAVDGKADRRIIEQLLQEKCVGMKGVRPEIRQQMLEFIENAGG